MATIKRVYLENQINSGKLQSFELVKRKQQPPELKLIWNQTKDKETTENLSSTLDVFSVVSLTLVADKEKPLSFKADIKL